MIRAKQRQILPIAIELEVQVQMPGEVRHTGAGSEHDHKLSGPQGQAREGPLGQVQRVVRQMPSGEIHGRRPGVLQFDPVRRLPVAVQECVLVGSHEF
jgi:hypothetical protein